MVIVKRSEENPILSPNNKNPWESDAAFNGSPVKDGDTYHMLYRALSAPTPYFSGITLKLSTIGYAKSYDGEHFLNRTQFITPEYDWEKFGCEDPRVTKLDGKYYICYTALSGYPFGANNIKVALAITRDFQTIEEKHLMTPFNAKATAIFPERINGKIAVIITANTDIPPAKIAVAFADTEADLWSPTFWNTWYGSLNEHVIPLQRSVHDHIELGSAPIRTEKGWLLFYSYIRNYTTPYRLFGIEAVLLDLENPQQIVSRITNPLLIPEMDYELYGDVANVIFPSGALMDGEEVKLYYGAADTTCCVATMSLKDLMNDFDSYASHNTKTTKKPIIKLDRFPGNPIIQPREFHAWESKAAFNPTAVYEGGKVHILYRAMGNDDTSVMGYANSADGIHIDERPAEPVYVPREPFEKKAAPGNSGCEDARITKIDDRIYMCYTAYDARGPTRVALTSIALDDFLNKRWTWDKPVLISPPGIDEKNSCIFPEKVNGKYVILHRIDPCIWIDFVDELHFADNQWIKGEILLDPRVARWDSEKVGIAGPPIKTEAGWLLIYHGVSKEDRKYRLGALLLDLHAPDKVLSRLDDPILEPSTEYENKGIRGGTVFSCGAVLINGTLYVYYGGADQYVGVATIELKRLLDALA